MVHPRGVRRERTLCGICRARGVNARTCPARGVDVEVIKDAIEAYGEARWLAAIAEAHAEMMLPRKFSEMMRERMAEFNGQSTLNVGLPIPEPVDVDADEDGVDSSQNKSGRAGNVERMMRAVEAALAAFIDALQN